MSSIDVSVAALLVSAILGALVARRAAYDRVLSALALLHEGDVAKARHRLGGLTFRFCHELGAGTSFPLNARETDRGIEDVFTILSAAIRLEAIRRSLGPRWPFRPEQRQVRKPLPGARGPHQLLVDSAGNWVDYWVRPASQAGNEVTLLAAIANCLGAKLDPDDDKSLRDLRGALAAWRVG